MLTSSLHQGFSTFSSYCSKCSLYPGVFVEFEEAAYTGIEGGDVSVSVLLRGSTERTVEVGFTSLVGTADGEERRREGG